MMIEFYVKVRPCSRDFETENGPLAKTKLSSSAENSGASTELIGRFTDVLKDKPGAILGKRRQKKLKVGMPEKQLNKRLESCENE